MPKYHISKHGEPARCDAEIKCRANGANTEHFEGELKDARKWAETKNSEAFGNTPAPLKKSRFSAPSPADKEKAKNNAALREKRMAEQEKERRERLAQAHSEAPAPDNSPEYNQAPDFSSYRKDGYSVINESMEPMDSVNPSPSGVFEEYDMVKYRATAPLSDNMSTYDQTAGVEAETMVTVYRGVPGDVETINNGDFITTNKQLADDYGMKVVSMKVSAKEILDSKDEPLGEEYIYRISE